MSAHSAVAPNAPAVAILIDATMEPRDALLVARQYGDATNPDTAANMASAGKSFHMIKSI